MTLGTTAQVRDERAVSDLASYSQIGAADRAALTALCVEYAWRVDNYYTETVPELFVDDGVWEAFGDPMIGKEALVKGWKARASIGDRLLRRHLISNLRFAKGSDGVVRGWHALTYFQGERGQTTMPSVTMVGEYHDTYQKNADGTWLFKTRKMIPIFPDSWSSPTPK